jgi:hypothetical protein
MAASFGRAAGAAIAPDTGALLVADDMGNLIWWVSGAERAAPIRSCRVIPRGTTLIAPLRCLVLLSSVGTMSIARSRLKLAFPRPAIGPLLA